MNTTGPGYSYVDNGETGVPLDIGVNGSPNPGGAITPTPEPSSLLLLGTGLFGLAFVAFRKAKSSTGALQTV